MLCQARHRPRVLSSPVAYLTNYHFKIAVATSETQPPMSHFHDHSLDSQEEAMTQWTLLVNVNPCSVGCCRRHRRERFSIDLVKIGEKTTAKTTNKKQANQVVQDVQSQQQYVGELEKDEIFRDKMPQNAWDVNRGGRNEPMRRIREERNRPQEGRRVERKTEREREKGGSSALGRERLSETAVFFR